MNSEKKVMDEIFFSGSENTSDMVVFSHVNWNSVVSRPREIISRMAEKRKIIFVEPPDFNHFSNEKKSDLIYVNKNITLLRPKIHPDKLNPSLIPDLKELMASMEIVNPVLWFFSASYASLANEIEHSGIIYDSMDFLTPLKGGYPDLRNHDRELLNKANLVITGGEFLFKSRKLFNNNTCLISNSIDFDHFASLSDPEVIPSDLKSLTGPIIGYFGIIDNRIDFELLHKVSKNMPEISFVLIGPHYLNIEEEIAGHPNIFYLGDKPFEELPGYLNAFTAGMFPFKVTQENDYLIPAQMLEFISLSKPVISTSVNEVVEEYNDEVSLISNHIEFMDKIEYYLNEPLIKKWLREKRYDDKKEICSWNTAVELVENFINNLIKSRSLDSTRDSSRNN